MEKVIFIDDEEHCYLLAQKILKEANPEREVVYYHDGLEAINFLKENNGTGQLLPDFIFIDLSMPVFSGWDFLNALQCIYQSLKKPIIVYVISSTIDPVEIKKTNNYPFVFAFISKPLTRNSLASLFIK
jgi:CheY-like chemotaxis protein